MRSRERLPGGILAGVSLQVGAGSPGVPGLGPAASVGYGLALRLRQTDRAVSVSRNLYLPGMRTVGTVRR